MIVQFEEENMLTQFVRRTPRESGLTGLAIRSGIVRTRAQADILFVLVTIACVITSIMVIVSGGSSTVPSKVTTPEELNRLMEINQTPQL